MARIPLPRYTVRVDHPGLGKIQIFSGTDRYVVEQRAQQKRRQWDEQWAKVESRRLDKESKESMRARAESLSDAAARDQEALASILEATLSVNDAIDWESLKCKRLFDEPMPVRPALFTQPRPNSNDPLFRSRRTLAQRLFPWKARKAAREQVARFERAIAEWERQRASAQAAHADFQRAAAAWNDRRASFMADQRRRNEALDKHRRRFEGRDTEAIADYFELVLTRSRYPEWFPQQFELEFNPETKLVAIDYELPAPSALPTTKEVRVVAARNELQEVRVADAEQRRVYQSVVYQLAIRTIHEILESDILGAVEVVAFNGWVTSLDEATGHDSHKCICSVCVKKVDFVGINLAKVDPKSCFRKLKGVAASELHSLTPVAPVVSLNRSDPRFVQSHDVAARLNEGVNLAAMDWEEFEYLVRELFEKEFASGGEVKVTRASRDGGVDAVAFDPDPIRGGKIVIQAKRYTNTVGVSAVRDLYGTVMNEGANKGILVCTSDYGPDAYEFIKGKPLTLLSGSNLLSMLEKHGHKAHIDLVAAKSVLAAEQRGPRKWG